MIIHSKQAEKDTVLAVARQMAAAARTAPKTKGLDYLETLILTDEDLEKLADQMEEEGNKHQLGFCIRDAGCVRASDALILIGTGHHTRNLNEACRFCGSKNCAECAEKGNACVYDPIDLGIAIGSAVSIAADARIDNRVMFSAGIAAKSLHLFEKDIEIVFGIPLSANGKNVYFDRKSKK